MIHDLYDKELFEECKSLRKLLVHRAFDKKQLKRCEFLRKLLERYGIKWKFKLERDNIDTSVVSFLPTFNGLYLHHNVDKILFNFYDDERFYTENEHDLVSGLTIATFYRFNRFAESRNKAEYLEVKRFLDGVIAIYKKKQNYVYQIERIDFERTVQNMILDGISFEGFPAIEEVL